MKSDKIAILIKMANLEFDKISNQIISPYDLTHSHFKTLKLLYKETPLTVRQIDIEKYFAMTNPTVTGILQNLEKKNMVERVVNPQDGRSKVIGLTEKAFGMKEELLQIGDKLEATLTANLEEEEQIQLISLLNKMLEKKEN